MRVPTLSKPGYLVASKAMAYISINHPYLCFSSETIDIINPDPYDPNIDEDGVTIEPPDNHQQLPINNINIVSNDVPEPGYMSWKKNWIQ
jgi:hypothetical protein